MGKVQAVEVQILTIKHETFKPSARDFVGARAIAKLYGQEAALKHLRRRRRR